MRVLYYTHPALFEPALCLVRELSRTIDVHLVLEVSPGAWRSAGFDLDARPLPPGLIRADDVLRDAFPNGVRSFWESATSFHLAVHPHRRSLHPSSWQISRSVLEFAREIGARILHIDDVDVSPRLAIALPGSSGQPTIVTVHDPVPHTGEHNWRKRLARALAYPRARRFILHNAALRDAFARRYRIAESNVDVARLGAYDICREWRPVSTQPATPIVLFFGRLSPYKGLDVFYDAARLVARRMPGVRFVVAGRAVSGYTPPVLCDLPGSEIDVRARYISNEETASLFANATVAVCPYRDATQSGVVLTAFAFGVPVVASNAGGLPEYVTHEETGLVVPAGDATATADAIWRLLRDPAYRATLSRNIAAARDARLGWRRAADVISNAYDRVRPSRSS